MHIAQMPAPLHGSTLRACKALDGEEGPPWKGAFVGIKTVCHSAHMEVDTK